MPDIADGLAEAERACLVAPAGCGKTETIVNAVSLCKGRQLVLTHTHAGVDSLRRRFHKKGVAASIFTIDTIAGWALRYVLAYPRLSRYDIPETNSAHDWQKVYEAFGNLMRTGMVHEIIRCSYGGVFIDEYQDCSLAQHGIVLSLSELLPCRVVGDPLQAIFGFSEPLVNWERDVYPIFPRLPDLSVSWRWQKPGASTGAAELGRWLLEVRAALTSGVPVDLRSSPPVVRWIATEPGNFNQVPNHCRRQAGLSGSVLILHHTASHCHSLARSLSGIYQSMEEMEAKDLIKFSKMMDTRSGTALAVALIDFSATCLTEVSTALRPAKNRYLKGTVASPTVRTRYAAIEIALNNVALRPSPQAILIALEAIYRDVPECKMHRKELWSEMRRTVSAQVEVPTRTLTECARLIRSRTSMLGRPSFPRLVSRTLLVKGLEFDHVSILAAETMDAKNLYVALTRPMASLSIFSPTSILNPVA